MPQHSTLRPACWLRLRALLNQPRQRMAALVAGAALAASPLAATAQGIPVNDVFFGINYWLNQPNATITADLKAAEMKLYRVGGNARNKMQSPAYDTKEDYDTPISYIKNSLLGEPLMQIPIGLTNAQVVEWVNYFKARGVKYYSIGNEPDPSPSNPSVSLDAWVNSSTPFEGYSFYDFRGRFKEIARLVKQTDNNCKILGGDFRNFYDVPISLYYSKFISDVGDEYITVGTRKIPLLDAFCFHYYDSAGRRERALKTRFDAVQALLDEVNVVRRGLDNTWIDLRMAITEVNTEANGGAWPPYRFNAGQFLATMTKLALEKRAFCVTPWSIFESNGNELTTDFSLYNSNNTRRSTMHHFALLSNNRRANYMPGEQESETYKDDIVFLGMRDSNGYTVMLMNTSATARSYSISLNNQYRGTNTVRIRLEGYAGVSTNLISGTIAAKTTLLFRLNAAGSAITSTLVYNETDAAPHARAATPDASTASAAPDTAADLEVYPNPAAASFTLAGLAGPGEVTLRSLTGQVLLRQQATPGASIDISRLPKGMYQATIRTAAGQVHRKVVKE